MQILTLKAPQCCSWKADSDSVNWCFSLFCCHTYWSLSHRGKPRNHRVWGPDALMSPRGTPWCYPWVCKDSLCAHSLALWDHQRVCWDLFPSGMCHVLPDVNLLLGPDGFCSPLQGRGAHASVGRRAWALAHWNGGKPRSSEWSCPWSSTLLCWGN